MFVFERFKVAPTEFVLSFQFQSNVSKKVCFEPLNLRFRKGNVSFWRKTFVLDNTNTLVSAWKTNLFCRLETFVPIRKTNLSPVERFVSIPKQTPDCIPSATRVAPHRSCQKKNGISGVMLEVGGYVCFPWTKYDKIPCVFDLVTSPRLLSSAPFFAAHLGNCHPTMGPHGKPNGDLQLI